MTTISPILDKRLECTKGHCCLIFQINSIQKTDDLVKSLIIGQLIWRNFSYNLSSITKQTQVQCGTMLSFFLFRKETPNFNVRFPAPIRVSIARIKWRWMLQGHFVLTLCAVFLVLFNILTVKRQSLMQLER